MHISNTSHHIYIYILDQPNLVGGGPLRPAAWPITFYIGLGRIVELELAAIEEKEEVELWRTAGSGRHWVVRQRAGSAAARGKVAAGA